MESPGLLLIGPGRHFGVDILRRFAKEGFKLGVISRTAGTVDAVRLALGQDGIGVLAGVADIANDEFTTSVRSVASGLRNLRCVIYNPKASVRGSGLELAGSDLAKTMAVNVTGAMIAIQAAAPLLTPGSSVILTGGGFKDAPDSERLALSVGKGALHTLALGMVEPLAKYKIDVKTVVIDGYVRSGGPIEPEDLADYYWEVFTSCDRVDFVFPGSRREKVSSRS